DAMAAVANPLRMSLAEFLDWDDGTDTLYELVEGRIVAMAPPNDAHGTIIMNIGLAIGPALKAPCRIVGNAGIVLPERDDRYYVADLAVTCDQPASQRRFLPEPRLIVEVLSRSTAAHDRGLKGEDYRQLASVQEILFVSNDERRVVRLRREVDHWAIDDFIGDASVRLVSIDATMSLSTIYANVAFGEPSTPAPDSGSEGRQQRRRKPATARRSRPRAKP
ncbi:MAG TPA: Uma2 family endonuclease, partial [Geminicoccaceae bacterium]|nr:Uma2 family endonuclease [Geminicoccaceae bacterium]